MKTTGSSVTKVPGIGTWLSVTLLWGTVFYATSVYMLKLAANWSADAYFNPTWSEFFSVFGLLHLPVLITFAIVAMLVKRVIDPEAKGQNERFKAIEEGRGERIFISLAGSIATSFTFALLTVGSYLAAGNLINVRTGFATDQVIYASLLNIAAGLAASVLVGIIFMFGKKKGA